MKKILMLLCAIMPVIGICQNKNVMTAQRVFPKMDKVLEFEKALAAHAQKYHSGDVSWRVFEIQSGPDAGGYMISEGPTTWDALDGRGDLSTEHTTDWNKNVTIYLTDRMSVMYAVFQDSLSTIALRDYAEKINITHVYPKIGKTLKVRNMIKKLRVAWQAEGSSIAVYSANSSGPAQFIIVNRYKQGLKEKTLGFRKPFKGTYETNNGDDSYDDYLDELALNVNDVWSELLFLRKELGSK